MKPHVEGAPGLTWRKTAKGWEALWRARADIVRKGFAPKNRRLWSGIEPTEIEAKMIADQCTSLQDEMLLFSRGGLPEIGTFDGTLAALAKCYQIDPDSTYHKSRFSVRRNHDRMLRRISDKHGDVRLADIRGRMILGWHKDWSHQGEKVAIGHAFVAMLRSLFGFGRTILEDPECERLSGLLSGMRFPMTKPRTERLTAHQAAAVRAQARIAGWPSIAIAQAIQFDLMLRQKDVIGEWVPLREPGMSATVRGGLKWVIGVDYAEIDAKLILRHTTSKRGKPIEVDLKLAPMVLEELAAVAGVTPGALAREHLPASGPIVVCETTGTPYSAAEFRRKWRICADLAGVPKEVKNMDSRSGAISEATDAGADLEKIRHAATHSDISMTQRYSRGSVEKTAEVMQLRKDYRSKNKE